MEHSAVGFSLRRLKKTLPELVKIALDGKMVRKILSKF